MNNHEKDQFLNIICKLHEIALYSNLSNDLLIALAGIFTIAKNEFEKPYPWPVYIIFTENEFKVFNSYQVKKFALPSNNSTKKTKE